MSGRDIILKNRLTGEECCKVTWRFGNNVLIRSFPATRANRAGLGS